MTSILNDDDICLDAINSLLTNWVDEQRQRLEKMLKQLEIISKIPADNLDELGNRLEDIDYHCSSLANILDLILSNYQDTTPPEYNNTNNNTNNDIHNEIIEFPVVDYIETSELKRWPLLQALWFHVMMATDPDSIYYSGNIGKSAWSQEYSPEL